MGSPARKSDTEGKATKAELARQLGVQPGTVAAAFRAGRIRRDADGLFDVEECRTYWAATRSRDPVQGDDADEAANAGADPQSLAAANLQKAWAQAGLAKMEEAKRKGELVSVADTAALWFGAYRVFRERLLAIPEQVAPLLAGQSDHDIRRLLDDAIRSALADLPTQAPLPQ